MKWDISVSATSFPGGRHFEKGWGLFTAEHAEWAEEAEEGIEQKGAKDAKELVRSASQELNPMTQRMPKILQPVILAIGVDVRLWRPIVKIPGLLTFG